MYFCAGSHESESMVPEMLSYFEMLNQRSKGKLKSLIRAEGKHSEDTWREEFPGFYAWMMHEEK